MFAALFSLLVFGVLLGIGSEIIMRVRLSLRETSGEKLAWWARGGDAVSTAYKELFPGSRIPVYRSLVFWMVVICAAAVLVASLWKSR